MRLSLAQVVLSKNTIAIITIKTIIPTISVPIVSHPKLIINLLSLLTTYKVLRIDGFYLLKLDNNLYIITSLLARTKD